MSSQAHIKADVKDWLEGETADDWIKSNIVATIDPFRSQLKDLLSPLE